jgi:hypothetical protein
MKGSLRKCWKTNKRTSKITIRIIKKRVGIKIRSWQIRVRKKKNLSRGIKKTKWNP